MRRRQEHVEQPRAHRVLTARADLHTHALAGDGERDGEPKAAGPRHTIAGGIQGFDCDVQRISHGGHTDDQPRSDGDEYEPQRHGVTEIELLCVSVTLWFVVIPRPS